MTTLLDVSERLSVTLAGEMIDGTGRRSAIPIRTMVDPGDVAVIHFTGRIAEGDAAGAVFDTTNVDVALEEGIYHDHRNYMPLEVRVGEGKLLEGCDRALQEMDVGERKTVELDPEDAFGERRERDVVEIPLDELTPADETTPLEAGQFVGSESGETGWIIDVEGERATIDFNHELAGLAIECELHVLAVQEEKQRSPPAE